MPRYSQEPPRDFFEDSALGDNRVHWETETVKQWAAGEGVHASAVVDDSEEYYFLINHEKIGRECEAWRDHIESFVGDDSVMWVIWIFCGICIAIVVFWLYRALQSSRARAMLKDSVRAGKRE